MVKKYRIKIITLLVLCFAVLISKAQSPEELVKKDFPKLYAKYGNSLKQQKARYVFAIDISNSMKKYESAVKSNIKNFISALPEGDFVTIIQKCGTSETDFIFSNQPVNSTTKSTIFSYIDAIKFDKIGSDGFKMTDKIIEALNQTGSSGDMKYVFMFTDFEYWTKNNQFNKNVENWKSLKTKFEQTQKGNYVSVTGLRLALSQGVKGSAVYETELKDIFGRVDILPSPNPVFLSTWFNNTKANILRDRLTYVIGKLARKEKQTIALSTKSENGKPAIILSKNSVFQKATLTDASLKEVNDIYNSRPLIGPFTPKPKTVKVDATLSSPDYNSDKGNEVEKITSLEISSHTIDVYQGPGYLPWYVGWPLLAFLLFWVICILYTIFLQKVTRIWSISISSKDRNGAIVLNNVTKSFTNPSALTIGKSTSTKNHFNVDGVSFCINIESRKNILCLPFPNKKSGYYITKTAGGPAELSLTNKKVALGNNQFIFLYKAGNFRPVTLTINETNQTFLINLK
jgi:hypothetical protein